MMIAVVNGLTILRGLLTLVFFVGSPTSRLIVLALAGISDGLDGYLARRFNAMSAFGAKLDAFMDKFFVCFVLGVFLYEGRLQIWEVAAFLARDIAYLFFGFYLLCCGIFFKLRFITVWYSKVFTTFQFFILVAVAMNIPIPFYIYLMLIGVSLLTLGQLYRAVQYE